MSGSIYSVPDYLPLRSIKSVPLDAHNLSLELYDSDDKEHVALRQLVQHGTRRRRLSFLDTMLRVQVSCSDGEIKWKIAGALVIGSFVTIYDTCQRHIECAMRCEKSLHKLRILKCCFERSFDGISHLSVVFICRRRLSDLHTKRLCEHLFSCLFHSSIPSDKNSCFVSLDENIKTSNYIV